MHGRETGCRSTGFVIGLTGEWGLGKSSVLNLVNEKLSNSKNVAVAVVNPWLFKTRDDLLTAYFNALRNALGKTLSDRARGVQEQLEKYKGAIGIGGFSIAAAIDIAGGNGAASTSWNLWGKPAVEKIKKPDPKSPDEERKALETKIKEAKIAVVVLIDELDRVEDDEVRAVAQMIKAVGDIKGISYLVAYDPKRVSQALGRGNGNERQASGEAYLEKIVQFSIPLRPLFEEDTRALLEAALYENGVDLPVAEADYQAAILDELIRVARTPREIKRLVGAFAVLEQMLGGEVCPYDVLGYSWLVAKAPGVRDAIAKNLEAVVHDPGERELARRMRALGNSDKKQETVTELLGEAAKEHEPILKLLFPRFGERDDTNVGNRIAKRRNLVRLLYLGSPPGMLSRSEVERIWRSDRIDSALEKFLALISTDRLAQFLDRLPDLLPNLDKEYDGIFWPALARCLVRKHDWITKQESLESLAEDVGETLWNFGRRTQTDARRVRSIFECLISDGDLIVAPWLLRKHLFAHNLTAHTSADSSEFVFSKEETIAYMHHESKRYSHALLSGTLLRNIPNTEAIYTLINAGLWSKDLKSSLTEQLNTIDAIITFAALTVRPGYIVSKETMDELIDSEILLERLVKFANDGLLPDDNWLSNCIVRLVATLRGHDPHFVRGYNSTEYIAVGIPASKSQ
jgi:hypothetical protein